jgi:hypothetical protein
MKSIFFTVLALGLNNIKIIYVHIRVRAAARGFPLCI